MNDIQEQIRNLGGLKRFISPNKLPIPKSKFMDPLSSRYLSPVHFRVQITSSPVSILYSNRIDNKY